MSQQSQPLTLDLSDRLLSYIPICTLDNKSSFYTGINGNLISPFSIVNNSDEKHTRFTAPLTVGKAHKLIELLYLHSNCKDSRIGHSIDTDIDVAKCYVEHPTGVIKIFTPVEDSGILINTTSNIYGIIAVLEAKYVNYHEQDGVAGKAIYTKRFSLDISFNMTTGIFKSEVYAKPYMYDAEFIYEGHNYLLNRNKKQMKNSNNLLAYFKVKGIELEAFVY